VHCLRLIRRLSRSAASIRLKPLASKLGTAVRDLVCSLPNRSPTLTCLCAQASDSQTIGLVSSAVHTGCLLPGQLKQLFALDMTGVDVCLLAKQAVESAASAALLGGTVLQQCSMVAGATGPTPSIRTQSMTMFRSTRETYGLPDVPSPTKANRRKASKSVTSFSMTASGVTAADMSALYPDGDGGDVIADAYKEEVRTGFSVEHVPVTTMAGT
jgi:hypothetical protein